MAGTKIDASHVLPHVLLLELWRASKPAAFFRISHLPSPNEPSIEACMERMSMNDFTRYVDYFEGRAIKTNLSDMSAIDTEHYDSYNGQGAFMKALERSVLQ